MVDANYLIKAAKRFMGPKEGAEAVAYMWAMMLLLAPEKDAQYMEQFIKDAIAYVDQELKKDEHKEDLTEFKIL